MLPPHLRITNAVHRLLCYAGMVPTAGVAPASHACRACILLLNYAGSGRLDLNQRSPDPQSGGDNHAPLRPVKCWSGWRDSDSRPLPPEGSALNQAELHPVR